VGIEAAVALLFPTEYETAKADAKAKGKERNATGILVS